MLVCAMFHVNGILNGGGRRAIQLTKCARYGFVTAHNAHNCCYTTATRLARAPPATQVSFCQAQPYNRLVLFWAAYCAFAWVQQNIKQTRVVFESVYCTLKDRWTDGSPPLLCFIQMKGEETNTKQETPVAPARSHSDWITRKAYAYKLVHACINAQRILFICELIRQPDRADHHVCVCVECTV